MAFKKSKKVHVTFDDSKRIISYEKDDVESLRHLFLQVFSDVLSADVAPVNVKFQQLDDTFKEYVDLENGQKLEQNARLKANIAPTKEKEKLQANSCCTNEADFLHCHRHLGSHLLTLVTIPGYPIQPSLISDTKFHPVNMNVSYRFWNSVSEGFVYTAGSSGNNVTCDGSFSAGANSVVQAKSVGNNEFNLVFNGNGQPSSWLYITSQGEAKQVTVASSPTAEFVFVPDYYWGHTMFRAKQYSHLYLGTDSNKNATLVPVEDPLYPNPQALFVVNKYRPPT